MNKKLGGLLTNLGGRLINTHSEMKERVNRRKAADKEKRNKKKLLSIKLYVNNFRYVIYVIYNVMINNLCDV